LFKAIFSKHRKKSKHKYFQT